MKARFHAGSDIATIAAWDAQRGAAPLSAREQKHFSEMLEAEAAEGRVFLVYMGGDGGGRVDVYVDEAIPPEVGDGLLPVAGERLLDLPSGRLVVEGAEYYRSLAPSATGTDGAVAVPAGRYSVRCYVRKDQEESARSENALRKLVGRADLEYYDRVNNKGCLNGLLTLLLFPVLVFPLGWKLAAGITAVVFVSFFHVRQWALKRNSRYQRLNEIVPAFRLEHGDPLFVLELRSLAEPGGLKGGSVSLDAPRPGQGR